MKRVMTSNLRPLLRAFYPFLIASAVLWVMPINASAQLYVTSDIVSEYDATKGAVINANLISYKSY